MNTHSSPSREVTAVNPVVMPGAQVPRAERTQAKLRSQEDARGLASPVLICCPLGRRPRLVTPGPAGSPPSWGGRAQHSRLCAECFQRNTQPRFGRDLRRHPNFL